MGRPTQDAVWTRSRLPLRPAATLCYPLVINDLSGSLYPRFGVAMLPTVSRLGLTYDGGQDLISAAIGGER